MEPEVTCPAPPAIFVESDCAARRHTVRPAPTRRFQARLPDGGRRWGRGRGEPEIHPGPRRAEVAVSAPARSLPSPALPRPPILGCSRPGRLVQGRGPQRKPGDGRGTTDASRRPTWDTSTRLCLRDTGELRRSLNMPSDFRAGPPGL